MKKLFYLFPCENSLSFGSFGKPQSTLDKLNLYLQNKVINHHCFSFIKSE